MIHEEIVTYEVCKLAKEKGFPQDVDRWIGDLHSATNSNYYNHKGELNGDCIEIVKCKIQKEEVPKEFELVAAPTQSLLQRWLREEKALHIQIILLEKGWYYDIWAFEYYEEEKEYSAKIFHQSPDFPIYELALEDALKYALENLV